MPLQLISKGIPSFPLRVLVRHIDAELLHLLGELVLVVAEGALEVVRPRHKGHPLHTRSVSPAATAWSPQNCVTDHLPPPMVPSIRHIPPLSTSDSHCRLWLVELVLAGAHCRRRRSCQRTAGDSRSRDHKASGSLSCNLNGHSQQSHTCSCSRNI